MNAEYHDAPEQQRLTNQPRACSLPVFASPLAACQTGRLAHGTATRRAAEDRPPTPKPIAVHILISDHEKTNIYQSGSKLQSSRESSTELTYAATRQQTAPENENTTASSISVAIRETMDAPPAAAGVTAPWLARRGWACCAASHAGHKIRPVGGAQAGQYTVAGVGTAGAGATNGQRAHSSVGGTGSFAAACASVFPIDV